MRAYTSDFNENQKLSANQIIANSIGLELAVQYDPAMMRFHVFIWERNGLKRETLCTAHKHYLHEVNSWIQQQFNDYNSWR